MHVLVIGAAGMVGRKLVEALVAKGEINGKLVERLTLVDIVEPTAPARFAGKAETVAADLSGEGVAAGLIAERPDLIFHLAAIVSGEAEADFEKGYRVNLDGTRELFEAIRLEGKKAPYKPKLVFTSSIAVFGEPLPAVIGDTHHHTPLTSYGTQKAIGELLLADYSRRGFFDGIGIRLPTIVIRPGKPNKAASGFFSNILREPLAGMEAVLPVEESVRHWFASPRAGGEVPDACGCARYVGAWQPAFADHAGTDGDRRRGDRGAAACGRRQGGEADPPRAGRDDRQDGRGLAAEFRCEPGDRARLRGRKIVRRDHPRACRGRTRRHDPGIVDPASNGVSTAGVPEGTSRDPGCA